MTALQANCPQCGAPLTRILCEYCGTLGITHPVVDEQRQALEVYHGLLAAKDEKAQINLLKNGFLPDDRDVLIEAGLRCVAMLGDETGPWAKTVVGRLRAIQTKLCLLPPDGVTQKALTGFDQALKRFNQNSRRALITGLAIVFGAIVFLCACWGLAMVYFWPK